MKIKDCLQGYISCHIIINAIEKNKMLWSFKKGKLTERKEKKEKSESVSKRRLHSTKSK